MTRKKPKKAGAPKGNKNAQKGKEALSAQVAFRIPASLRADLELIAEQKGVKISPLVAEILTKAAARMKSQAAQ